MRENRGPWYLLTGLLLGLVLGVAYAWLVSPVQYIDTPPASLRPDFKDQYRALIAFSYSATGDLNRARVRLSLLGDSDSASMLASQAQQAPAEGRSQAEVLSLGQLAVALGATLPATTAQTGATATLTSQVDTTPSPTSLPSSTILPTKTAATPSTSMPSLTPTPTSTPTQSPLATFTPLPTRTPTATPGSPFVLQDRDFVCDRALAQPLIQIQVLDAAEQPIPGVEIVVGWDGGQDRFFTGLKPEMGLGYADFLMVPDVDYTLRLTEGGQVVSDLSAAECETAVGERYWGAWSLIFVQP